MKNEGNKRLHNPIPVSWCQSAPSLHFLITFGVHAGNLMDVAGGDCN